MVISQLPWPLSFPAGRHGPVPYCVDVRASLVELCASFDVSVLHRVRCVLLHSPKAHSRAGHPCVDDKTELVRPAWPHASMTCARMATPKSGQRSFSVDAARLALAMAEMLTPAYGAPSLELLDESRETAVGVRAGATGESTAHQNQHAPAAHALHCVCRVDVRMTAHPHSPSQPDAVALVTRSACGRARAEDGSQATSRPTTLAGRTLTKRVRACRRSPKCRATRNGSALACYSA